MSIRIAVVVPPSLPLPSLSVTLKVFVMMAKGDPNALHLNIVMCASYMVCIVVFAAVTAVQMANVTIT